MTDVPRRAFNTPWALNDGQNIGLLTVDELLRLPAGTELYCIDGSKVIVGVDKIDLDLRFGVLAYGLPIPTTFCPACAEIATDPETSKRPADDHQLFAITGHFPDCKQAP